MGRATVREHWPTQEISCTVKILLYSINITPYSVERSDRLCVGQQIGFRLRIPQTVVCLTQTVQLSEHGVLLSQLLKVSDGSQGQVDLVVNELLAAGAEAVSINGERVVATTAIRCVGPTILVNNVRSSVPFVIKAIGDPLALEGAMNMNGGIVSELRAYQNKVTIQRSDRIDMKAYTGALTFNHVTSVKKEES